MQIAIKIIAKLIIEGIGIYIGGWPCEISSYKITKTIKVKNASIINVQKITT